MRFAPQVKVSLNRLKSILGKCLLRKGHVSEASQVNLPQPVGFSGCHEDRFIRTKHLLGHFRKQPAQALTRQAQLNFAKQFKGKRGRPRKAGAKTSRSGLNLGGSSGSGKLAKLNKHAKTVKGKRSKRAKGKRSKKSSKKVPLTKVQDSTCNNDPQDEALPMEAQSAKMKRKGRAPEPDATKPKRISKAQGAGPKTKKAKSNQASQQDKGSKKKRTKKQANVKHDPPHPEDVAWLVNEFLEATHYVDPNLPLEEFKVKTRFHHAVSPEFVCTMYWTRMACGLRRRSTNESVAYFSFNGTSHPYYGMALSVKSCTFLVP